MAQSRLEKIGTIYTRVTGLLRSGAMKPDDRPLWYDLYEAFPPKLEPKFDRPATQIAIKNIFYEEDKIRAKFHKSLKQQEMINMFDRKRETQTQQFIKIYKDLKSQGALDEEKIFETSVDLLQQQRAQMKVDAQEISMDNANVEDSKVNLSEAFSDAKTATYSESAKPPRKSQTGLVSGIDIKNLFKD